MNQSNIDSSDYPFSSGKAYLGWATRKSLVRYSFDGRRLVIYEAKHVRLLIIVAGALLGPGFSLALVMGRVKPEPWYVLAMLVAFNIVAWIGWIDALRNKYEIACDLVSREMKFLFHPLRAPRFTLSLDDVDDASVVTLKRKRTGGQMRAYSEEEIIRYKLRTIDCFSVVLVRKDGERFHLVETTDRTVAESIHDILRGALARP
jgi:hypothetical protein